MKRKKRRRLTKNGKKTSRNKLEDKAKRRKDANDVCGDRRDIKTDIQWPNKRNIAHQTRGEAHGRKRRQNGKDGSQNTQ